MLGRHSEFAKSFFFETFLFRGGISSRPFPERCETLAVTNRLFQVIVSGWVIYDSRMCFCNPITRSADAAEGPDSIVHFIAFSDLSPMPGWRIHLQTKEPSHKSAAAGRIDPPNESFQCLTLYCNFEGLSWNCIAKTPACCLLFSPASFT